MPQPDTRIDMNLFRVLDAIYSITAIRARMAALREVRARLFSEQESQAMFGLSDADDEDAVARLAISQDATLDEAQKREKLAALDAALPAALRKAREEPVKVLKLEETVAPDEQRIG